MSRHLPSHRGLSRRFFLGGGAVVLGLPFLESLAPRTAQAQAAAKMTRIFY